MYNRRGAQAQINHITHPERYIDLEIAAENKNALEAVLEIANQRQHPRKVTWYQERLQKIYDYIIKTRNMKSLFPTCENYATQGREILKLLEQSSARVLQLETALKLLLNNSSLSPHQSQVITEALSQQPGDE